MAMRPEPSSPAHPQLLGRFAFRLRGFLRRPLAPADCRERVRREPFATGAGKVLALHVLEPGIKAAPDGARP